MWDLINLDFMCFQLNFVVVGAGTQTFHFGISMFSKLTAGRITAMPHTKPHPLPARRSIYRISMKTTYSKFWETTSELYLGSLLGVRSICCCLFKPKFAICCRSAAL